MLLYPSVHLNLPCMPSLTLPYFSLFFLCPLPYHNISIDLQQSLTCPPSLSLAPTPPFPDNH